MVLDLLAFIRAEMGGGNQRVFDTTGFANCHGRAE